MKRKHRLGTAALVAAVLLTLAIGTALAAGYLSGTIDWRGRPVRENEADIPSPTTSPGETTDQDALDIYGGEILAQQPEGEYWILEEAPGRAHATECRITFGSLDELNEFLRLNAPDFRLAETAPEGYAFRQAHCAFYFTKEMVENAAVTREDAGHGLTLVRVRFGEGALIHVESYGVDFQTPAGGEIRVSAWRTATELDDHAFGVWEGDVYEPVEIEGMKYALHLERGESRKLYMVHKAQKSRGYTTLFDIPAILDGSDGGNTFKYVDYVIQSDSLTRKELLDYGASLR